MKIQNHSFLTGLVLLFCHFFGAAVAQDRPGIRDSVYSEILQEKRIIQVILPQDYKPGAEEKYDVLYLLDGQWTTKLASHIQPYLKDEGFMPSSIVVGVISTNRNRDFLPKKMEGDTLSHGADNFFSFLKEELIPYVNNKYPSNGENTLFGASFGGTFAMYSFLKDPLLFQSYIAGDPALWWDNGYLKELAAEKLAHYKDQNATVYIGGREGGAYEGMGVAAMDSIFQLQDPEGLRWKCQAYPNETHGSVNFKTLYDGLKFSYAGYNPQKLVFHPMNGIMLKNKPIKVWCRGDLTSVRYTIDGTEPVASSAKMEKEVILKGPAEFKLKPFSNRSRHDKTASGNFIEGKALRASSKPKKATPGGFRYSYFEGEWDSLPDFRKLKPVQTGCADKDFNITRLPQKNGFACLLEGHLEIQKEGYYIFLLDSYDWSRFYVGDQLLIDYDSVHGRGEPKSYIIPLKKGFYPLRLEYFQKNGRSGLDLVYMVSEEKEDARPGPIPFELQYSME